MNWIIPFIFAVLTVAVLSQAAPSRRPLPEHIPDQTNRMVFLRDHEKKHLYYGIPRVFSVKENVLQSYGNQEEGCKAVDNYKSAGRVLVETKQELATISLKRSKIVSELLATVLELENEKTQLALEKQNIDHKIKAEPGDTEESKKRIAALQTRLDEIKDWLDHFDNRITHIKELQALAQKEQEEVLKQVETLEKSLESFEVQVVKPAGNLRVRLAVEEQVDSTELRNRLGLSKDEIVELPNIVGLSLYPITAADVDFRERSAIEEGVGVYTPEWNIRPITYSETYFGEPTLSSSLRKHAFPDKLFYEQILSLYKYCAIEGLVKLDRQFAFPLRVSFTIAGWEDELQRSAPRLELLHYTTILGPQAWTGLAAVPAYSGGTTQTRQDPGSPEYFSGKGLYQPFQYNFAFKFNAQPNQGENQ